MSRFEAYADQIENDPTIPQESRIAIAASLRAVVASQAARDSVEVTPEVIALLSRASRYLLLADRLHSTEPKSLIAILLAVCDLQQKPRKPSGGYTHGKRKEDAA